MKRMAWLMLGLASCRPSSTETVVPARAVAAPVESEPPDDRRLPSLAEIRIPLLEGGALELRELEGRVVLLELGTPTHPGWNEASQTWRTLVEEVGREHLEVVVIGTELEPSSTDWELSPFVLGWDPQSVLALRLGVERVPARLVFDRQGRCVATSSGTELEGHRATESLLRRLLKERS